MHIHVHKYRNSIHAHAYCYIHIYRTHIYLHVCMSTCYSAPSRFLLRGAPDYSADTESEFHAEAHEQLRVKDLPRVPTRRLEVDSNPQPSGCKAPNIPLHHRASHACTTLHDTRIHAHLHCHACIHTKYPADVILPPSSSLLACVHFGFFRTAITLKFVHTRTAMIF